MSAEPMVDSSSDSRGRLEHLLENKAFKTREGTLKSVLISNPEVEVGSGFLVWAKGFGRGKSSSTFQVEFVKHSGKDLLATMSIVV